MIYSMIIGWGKSTKRNVFSIIVRILASTLLFWALSNHQYDYYVLLRWVVCASAAYSAYLAVKTEKIPWAWTMGIMALLFNPIIPLHLSRQTWTYIDIIAGTIFLISIFFVKIRGRPQSKVD